MKLEWKTVVYQNAIVQRKDGRRLMLGIGAAPGGKFVAIALESSAEAVASTNPALLFDDHAHEAITTKARTIEGAMKAAARYAGKWKRAATVAPPCDCGPVGAK